MMPTNLENILNRGQPLALDAAMMCIVNENADVESTDVNGLSLMHLLLENPQNVYYSNAIKATVQTLIDEYGASINTTGKIGKTPLQLILDRPNCLATNVFFLLQAGADPNTKNSSGRPLLHILSENYPAGGAISANSLDVINTLVNHYKVDIDTPDETGKTLLQKLVNRFWHTRDALFLVRLGADPAQENISGNPLLHNLVTCITAGINTVNRDAIAELVKHHHVDIHSKNRIGQTALECLMEQPNGFRAEDAVFLVSLGADPNSKNAKGESLLHILAKSNKDNSAAIKTLIKDFKADFTQTNALHKTPVQTIFDAIKKGECRTLINLNALMQFDKTKQLVIDDFAKINKFYKMTNNLFSADRSNAQRQLRNGLYEKLIQSLEGKTDDEQLKQLRKARELEVFASHRSAFFLARMGRTNTVIKIDKKIDAILAKQSASPTL